ncbi:MAG: pyrroline-5-carboxylate reductase [Planctomycetia bacterium]|nr:pyrroline-5-carboxylate reductase [Planctomycetia bacterium]
MAEKSNFPRIGFIGAGRMATAMIQALLRSKMTTADRIVASDVVEEARDVLADLTQVKVHAENKPVVDSSDVIFLAVKPQVMAEVLLELKPMLTAKHLVVSVAAGVTLTQLSAILGSKARLVRVMPNTPILVGAGAAGFCLGAKATFDDAELVQRILNTLGKAVELPERLIDAVTGLSASGPAYIAVIIEALADGGVRAGLSRDVANLLATQTVYGTAKMLLETGLHPAMLKDMVASPGGTTIAGLHAMESGAVRCSMMDAVLAAASRASELGKS